MSYDAWDSLSDYLSEQHPDVYEMFVNHPARGEIRDTLLTIVNAQCERFHYVVNSPSEKQVKENEEAPVSDTVLVAIAEVFSDLHKIAEHIEHHTHPLRCGHCDAILTEASGPGHWETCPKHPAHATLEALRETVKTQHTLVSDQHNIITSLEERIAHLEGVEESLQREMREAEGEAIKALQSLTGLQAQLGITGEGDAGS